MKFSFSQGVESVTETGLGLPGEFFDPSQGTFLSFGKLGADLGGDAVVGSLFDEDPAGVGIKRSFLDGTECSPKGEGWRKRRSESISAFGDSSLPFAGAAGVFSGNKAKEGHEFLRVLEAAEGSNFRDGDHGGDELKSFEGHHGINERFALPVLQELKHGFFEFFDALMVEVDGR